MFVCVGERESERVKVGERRLMRRPELGYLLTRGISGRRAFGYLKHCLSTRLMSLVTFSVSPVGFSCLCVATCCFSLGGPLMLAQSKIAYS